MKSTFLTLGLLVLLAPTSHAQAPRIVTLDNGLTVLLAPDSLATTVDVGVWWDSGTRREKEGQSGLTYVMGRLLMRTPTAALERRRRLESLGAATASIVQPDFLGLSTTVPPDALGDALEVEAARLGSLRFSSADFATEVAAVRDERTRRMASPVGVGLERLYGTAYGAHAYGRPVIGRDADLRALTFAAADAHARRALEPGRALLTVVGRFDPEPTLQSIRGRFGALPKPGPRAATTTPALPAARPRATVTAESTVPLMLMSWRGPASGDDAAALEVLRYILGASTDGLHAELGGPRGKVAQIQADFDRRALGSLLFVLAAVPKREDSTEVEHRLQAAVQRAATEPLPEAALERGRRRAEMAELVSRQTTRGRAQALVTDWYLTGGKTAEGRDIERLRAVTAADVQRVAASTLVSGKRSIVWLTPATPGAGGASR